MEKNNNISKKATVSKQINANDFLEIARRSIKDSNYIEGEYYINLILISEDLDFQVKIQALAIKSFIHFTANREPTVIRVASKFLKELKTKENGGFDQDIVYCLIRALYRCGNILNSKQKIYLSSYFYYKVKNFLDTSTTQNVDNDTYKSIEEKFSHVLNELSSILLSDKSRVLQDLSEKNSFLKNLQHFLNTDRPNFIPNLSTANNGETFYIISTLWMKKLIFFLKKNTNSDYIDKSFDRRNVCLLYFNEGDVKEELKRYLGNYPGPINNYFIVKMKDLWVDNHPEFTYSNTVVKSNLKENIDYLIINEELWTNLSDFFGFDFVIQRKKIFTETQDEPAIEVNLKCVKILVLCQVLNNESKNLIKPMYVQLSKRDTLLDLKRKLLRCIINILPQCSETMTEDKIQIKYIIPDVDNKSRKKLYLEIVYSYTNKFASLKIKGEEVIDESILVDVKFTFYNFRILKWE
jgi:hypothetical protein